MIYDRRIASQTLGCIFNNPALLADTDQCLLTNDDFADRLHKIVFAAIYNLYHDGLQIMNVGDITNYISKYPDQYSFFTEKEGSSFILTSSEIAEQNSFKFYYTKLKKLSVLRNLQASGYDISPFYDTQVLEIAKRFAIEKKFEESEVSDIINHYLGGLAEIESKYINKKTFTLESASEGLSELKERLKLAPEFGHGLNGDMFTSIVKGARKSKFYLYSGGTGVGKAVPNYTEIPTPNGVKKVGDIKVGDYVFGKNGKPTKILAVYPQKEQKKIFKVHFSDGRIAESCDEHLWEYKFRTGYVPQVNSLKKMIEQSKNLGGYKDKKGYFFKVPVSQAVEYDEKEYKINPYTMGALLGDGSFRIGSGSPSLSFSSADEEIVVNIANLESWHYFKEKSNNYSWYFRKEFDTRSRISVTEVVDDKLVNVKSEDKFIPKEYLFGNIEQRFALLQGLLDTDGSIDSKGRVSYVTISGKLKNDVVYLAQSLGLIATVIPDKREEKYSNGLCYIVHIQSDKDIKPKLFRLSRKANIAKEYANNGKRSESKDYIAITNIEETNLYTDMTCFTVDSNDHLFLMNDFIVTHNTRVAVGNACRLAYPFYFDTQKDKWVEQGATQRVLFITTELEADEIRTMILAYLSGVPEDHILEGRYGEREEKRVDEAIKIVDYFKEHFIIYHMPDPNIHQLNTNVRRLVIAHKINGLFYDYIHTSPGLLMEFSGFKIREDVVLNMLSTALKNLANEMGIFVWSGTQLNASADDFEFAGPHNLRGSRSIADKLDVGILARRVTPEALKSVSHILNNSLYKPTAYEDFYKNRRSKYTQIRLWTEIDLGTCRKKDLFATDGYGNLIDLELIFPKDTSITVTLNDVLSLKVAPQKPEPVKLKIEEVETIEEEKVEVKKPTYARKITL